MNNRQRRRQRETVIPAAELGWHPPATTGEISWVIQEDLPTQMFNSRQFHRPAERVDPRLRRAVSKRSALQNVQLGELKERRKNRTEWLRTRTPRDARLSPLENPKEIPSRSLFQREVEELHREVGKLIVPPWFKRCIPIPLGPEKLDRMMDGLPRILSHHRFELLTYNAQNTAMMFIEPHISPGVTKSIVTEAFGPSRVERESFLLTAPNSGFAVDLRHGKDPNYVARGSETTYAVVHDDIHVAANEFPKECVEQRLQMRIKWTRLVTEPERRWIEKRTGVEEKKMRIICFYSKEDRKRAEERVKMIDFLYCPMMFNCAEDYEVFFLNVRYDNRPKHREGVKVTLVYETDKRFAEDVFARCSLRVHYFDEKNEIDDELKFCPNNRELVLQDFPQQFRSFNDRCWFVNKIAAKNQLQIEQLDPHSEIVDRATRTFKAALRRNIKSVIDYEILKVAHQSRIWRPLDMPWDQEQNGGLAARFFHKPILERPDRPWFTKRYGQGAINAEDEMFTVFFETPALARRLIPEILDFSHREPVFRCDESDIVGPELEPVYRITTSISRQMRVMYDKALSDFDIRLRTTFPSLSEMEDSLMQSPESQFFSIRVFEEWKTWETGSIGVEGWSPRGVRLFFSQLQDLLRPVEFSTENYPQLTCGIGEVYVRYLEKKYENMVIIDVDKFRQVLTIYGTNSGQVVEDLKNFDTAKKSFQVNSTIPMYFPMFNEAALDLLTPRVISKLGNSLGAQCVLSGKEIGFSGTIEAYEEMTNALASISSEVYRQYVSNLSSPPVDLQCPACFCETGDSSDYYRFHCGHAMCRACVNNMISARIDESRLKIQCEVENCKAFVTPDDILHIILGGLERIPKLDAVKLERMTARAKQALVISNPDIKACSTVDCVGILIRETSEGELKKCDACQREYCRNCLLEPHAGHSCAEYAKLRIPDNSIAAYVNSVGRENIKKCPNCQVWVHKNDGCNHIACSCGTHFCWVCLYVAESESDCYAHLRKVHNTYGGPFQMIEGRLVANEPELQAELDMQQLMIGDEPNGVPAGIPPRDDQFADDEQEPPRLLTELPPELIIEFPRVFVDDLNLQQRAVDYLNTARTAEQRADRIAEIRVFAMNPDGIDF